MHPSASHAEVGICDWIGDDADRSRKTLSIFSINRTSAVAIIPVGIYARGEVKDRRIASFFIDIDNVNRSTAPITVSTFAGNSREFFSKYIRPSSRAVSHAKVLSRQAAPIKSTIIKVQVTTLFEFLFIRKPSFN